MIDNFLKTILDRNFKIVVKKLSKKTRIISFGRNAQKNVKEACKIIKKYKIYEF